VNKYQGNATFVPPINRVKDAQYRGVYFARVAWEYTDGPSNNWVPGIWFQFTGKRCPGHLCQEKGEPNKLPPQEWDLAMNINPSDGQNFGWGNWPVDGAARGSNGYGPGSGDYCDSTTWMAPASYIAIVRHDDGVCQAARVWAYATPSTSLYDIFKTDTTYQRATLTSGGPLFTSIAAGNNLETSDPVLGCEGNLVVNWWYSNNGARIALDCGHLSAAGTNDDDTHGLGNEFGATTNSGNMAVNSGSGSWWHDASALQGDCHGGNCITQGTDHGTALHTGTQLGQYAVFVSNSASAFSC
jgi:hypothetical protein